MGNWGFHRFDVKLKPIVTLILSLCETICHLFKWLIFFFLFSGKGDYSIDEKDLSNDRKEILKEPTIKILPEEVEIDNDEEE